MKILAQQNDRQHSQALSKPNIRKTPENKKQNKEKKHLKQEAI
uniref:Uncharacterized protein n=1 Tax=Rhizophora mucronata TaxID=61149 RepID=A0A2P2JSQ1_RHIMU